MDLYIFGIALVTFVANLILKGKQRRWLSWIFLWPFAVVCGVLASRSYHFWREGFSFTPPRSSSHQDMSFRLFVIEVLQTVVCLALPIYWYLRDQRRERQANLILSTAIVPDDPSIWPPAPKA